MCKQDDLPAGAPASHLDNGNESICRAFNIFSTSNLSHFEQRRLVPLFSSYMAVWEVGSYRLDDKRSAWVQCYLQARKMNHAISQETIYRASI